MQPTGKLTRKQNPRIPLTAPQNRFRGCAQWWLPYLEKILEDPHCLVPRYSSLVWRNKFSSQFYVEKLFRGWVENHPHHLGRQCYRRPPTWKPHGTISSLVFWRSWVFFSARWERVQLAEPELSSHPVDSAIWMDPFTGEGKWSLYRKIVGVLLNA